MALCILSGVLLWAGFFPLNQGWVGWCALVPMLLLVRMEVSSGRILVATFVAGFLTCLASLQWMRVAHPMMLWAWLALAAYLGAYFPVSILLLRRIDRRLKMPLTFSVPIVWVSLEYLRSYLITGFQWYFLGHTQHDYLALIQIVDVGGVYAVSFLVAAVNGLVAEMIWSRRTHQGSTRIPQFLQAGLVAVAIAGTVGYGMWRLGQRDFGDGPRVAMLQTNVEQGIRNSKRDSGPDGVVAINAIEKHTLELTDRVLKENQNPDLIIWPETTFADDWVDVARGTPESELPKNFRQVQDMVRGIVVNRARYSKSAVLLGLNTQEFVPGRRMERFNSALLVDQNQPLARYDKIHCVPFGEYVPLKESLPFMQRFWVYDHDFSLTPGRNVTRFSLNTAQGEFKFGVLICYEDSVAHLARPYARWEGDERPVDFLVNISNDGWFDGTEEHEEHLVLSRFRAVESRRAVVRAVNMGISALIDGNGRIRALPRESWSASKKVAAAFTAAVPIDTRTSMYAMLGDWFAAFCCVTGLAVLGATVFYSPAVYSRA